MQEIDASEQLLELAFLALDHGAESLEDTKGPLSPFILVENTEGERELRRFVGSTLDEAQQQARARLRELADGDRVALAYDGYVNIDGTRTDAVIVEAQERSREDSVVFAQRYRRARFSKRPELVGNAAFLGDGEALL
jgi:hypothetical protein